MNVECHSGGTIGSPKLTGAGTVKLTALRYTAPANRPALVWLSEITLGGISPTDAKPIVEIVIDSTGGTPGSTPTPGITDSNNAAGCVASGTAEADFSAVAVGGTVVKGPCYVHPQYGVQFREPIELKPGGNIAINVTPNGVAVPYVARFKIREG
jgi:hypothetical protein